MCYLRSKRLYRTGNSFIEHFTAIADPSALKLCKAFNTHMHMYICVYACVRVRVCVSAWAEDPTHSSSSDGGRGVYLLLGFGQTGGQNSNNFLVAFRQCRQVNNQAEGSRPPSDGDSRQAALE